MRQDRFAAKPDTDVAANVHGMPRVDAILIPAGLFAGGGLIKRPSVLISGDRGAVAPATP
jgi:hypothetical protein